MAGGPPTIILAILYGIAGLLLILFPPAVAIPKPIGFVALALVVACSLSFLPANWFGMPVWRAAVQAHPDILLGSLATPQPWHTLEGLGMLVAGIVLGLFLLCQPVDRRAHRKLAGAFTLGVGAFATLAIFAAETGWTHPWDAFGTFGFLPNRNHVGTLLMLGAIAGAGPFMDGIARRRWNFVIPLGLAFGVIMVAILAYNSSRAGALLFFIGLFTWLAGSVRKNMDRRILIAALVLSVLTLGIFVTSRTEAWQRLTTSSTSATPSQSSNADSSSLEAPQAPLQPAQALPLDFRMLIYGDTCRMILDNPITGVGLGNFRYVFPQYRRDSASELFCLHPESTWLELAAEGGLLALLLAATLVVLAFLRLRNVPDHPSWTVRWASATAVLMFVIHCMVDVPGHRTPTLWPALFLAGLAFRATLNERDKRHGTPWASRSLFVVSGIALLGASAWLAGIIPHTQQVPATVEAEKARYQAYDLYKGKKAEEAITVLKKALTRTPLAHTLYAQWGMLELTFTDTDDTVDRLFADARFLEPCFGDTVIQQAKAWFPVDADRSLKLYAEAFARVEKEKQWGVGLKFTLDTVLEALNRAEEQKYAEALARDEKQKQWATGEKADSEPIIQSYAYTLRTVDRFLPLTKNKPELLLVWMRYASPQAVRQAIANLISRDPALAEWNNADRLTLFHLWWKRGNETPSLNLRRDNEEGLLKLLGGQPPLKEAGWPVFAGILAKNKEYEQAWRISAEKIHLTPPLPSKSANPQGIIDIPHLQLWFAEHKTRTTALQLAQALFEEESYKDVLQVAEVAHPLASCRSPKLSRFASMAAARLERWQDAWNWAASTILQETPMLSPNPEPPIPPPIPPPTPAPK